MPRNDCSTCGGRGWTVQGSLYDGSAEQVPCPACDEYEVAKRAVLDALTSEAPASEEMKP